MSPVFFCAYGSRGNDRISVKAEASFDARYAVVGVPVCYSVEIRSNTDAIEYIRLEDDFRHEGFSIMRIASSDRDLQIKSDGKGAYVTVPLHVALIPLKTGTLAIPKINFIVGIGQKVIRRHPLWGRYHDTEITEISVTAPVAKLNVKEIGDTSDAIETAGIFRISGRIPPGRITVGTEMLAIYTIEGDGWIGDDATPDILGALPDGLSFVSASPKIYHWLEGSNLKSRLEIECLLRPSISGKTTIGSVTLQYFNTQKGHKGILRSEAITFDVHAVKTQSPSSSAIHEI